MADDINRQRVLNFFAAYYGGAQSALFGSMFTLTVPFAITGNANAVNAVSVTLTNSLGSSAAMSRTF